jgi:hypothetical protein
VDLRAGLDRELEEKFSASARDRTSIAQSYSPKPDTILTELPGSHRCCIVSINIDYLISP